jgi:hypothetical protein
MRTSRKKLLFAVGIVDRGAQGSQCSELIQVGYSGADYKSGKPLPFELAGAYVLYQELFSKIEDLIKDKHLLLEPVAVLGNRAYENYARIEKARPGR